MKLYAECISCQLQVRYREISMLFNSEGERIEAMRRVVEELNRLLSSCDDKNSARCIPTYIATELFRLVKRLSDTEDPYLRFKIELHKKLLDAYREASEWISMLGDLREKLLMAIKFSIAGNLLDMGVVNYKPPEAAELLRKTLTLEIHGDINAALEIIEKARNIVVILDNAGEAVLDRLLADVLKSSGKNVTAVIKGGAFQNDVSINDAPYAELEKSFSRVIDSGIDASSIFLSDVKKEVIDAVVNADVIISKGMANYEYLTEVENVIGRPIIYLFVAKCYPVSVYSGVPLWKPGVIVHV